MKQISFTLIILSFLFKVGIAQNPIDISIELFEPYPTELEYYLENADNLFITVTNTTGIDQKVFYHVRLIGLNNGIDVQTFPNIKPGEPVTVPSNRTLFYSSEELERDFPFSYPEDIDLGGMSQEQMDFITFNKALPEGTYQLCITALDYNTNTPLSFQCSDEFSVSYGDIPYIYQPFDEEVVFASDNSHVTIGWEPPFTLVPPPGTFEYTLKMIDITNDEFGDLELMFTNPGTYSILEVSALTEPIYNYDFPPEIELEDGHQYALRVQAMDNTGTFPLANNGYSEISTFWYGHNPNEEDDSNEDEISDNQSDCYENCYYTNTIDENPANSVSAFEEIQIGQFAISNLNFTQSDGASASGTGEILIPFLNDVRINVSFNNLGINSQGRVYQGTVNAIIDQAYDPSQMNSDIAQEMNNFIRNGRVIGALVSGGSIGMPLGLMQNIAGHNFMFGFTQMSFSPTTASCQLMQNLHIPQFGEEGWISMAGSDICLIPAGFGGEFAINPVNDYNIPYDGDLTFVINGSGSGELETIKEEATFFEMDCNGVKSFGLQGEVHFPRNTLVPEESDGTIGEDKVIGSFSALFDRTVDEENNVYAQYGEEGVPEESGLHFMVEVDIDPFQIAGIYGWGYEVQNAWVDCSDFENPPAIKWPESYDDANISIQSDGSSIMEPTWTGVFIKSLELKTPQDFLGSNRRESIGLENMIIDPLVSLTVAAKDIIGRDEGEVDGWSLSMDSLFMTIVQNRLESGGFSGQLGVPITDEDQYFRYTAIIEDSDTENTSLDPPSYVFSVSPEDDIDFPFMAAKAALSENSYVLGKFTPSNEQETYFETYLEGGVSIVTDLFTTEDGEANVPLELPIVDFNLTYNSQTGFEGEHFGFAGLEPVQSEVTGQEINYDASWGLEFSEETFGGFPLSIESAGLSSPSPSEIVFNVTPRVSIAGKEGGIAGSVGIDFNSELKTISGEKKFKLQNIDISSLYIYSEVHGLTIEGEIEFYNDIGNDQVGNKGARGELLTMLPIGVGVKLAAEFGTSISNPGAAFGTSENYNYWYLDGMVYLGEIGTPIAPGVGLHGLGGGVFVNMTRGRYGESLDQSDVNDMLGDVNDLDESSAGNNEVTRTGTLPTPSFGSYGLKLATTIATNPVSQACNMDVSLYGEFSQNQGLNMIEVMGDAFLMTPLSLRQKANFWASASMAWEKVSNDHHIFDGTLDIFVSAPSIGTPLLFGNPDNNYKMIGAAFHAESGGANKWYFHAGNPDQRGELNFKFPFFPSISASGYLMTGHDLPTELPVPDRVAWLLDNPSTGDSKNNLDNSDPVKANGEERHESHSMMAELGNGIAFGAELEATASIDAFLIYATCSAFLGFDINITQSEERSCFIPGEGSIAPGINGWYARGQVYAGLEGDIGIKFRFCKKDYNLSLFKMGAAMMVSGGGPNPEWIEGRAGVNYSVLAGKVKGYKKFDITIGDKCVPEYEDPFGGLEIIYENYPGDGEQDVSVFVDPIVSFILPINEDIVLPILKEDGSVKDMTIYLEMESLSIKERTSSIMTSNGTVSSGAQTIQQKEQVWNEDNNQVIVKFDEVLTELRYHDATIKLIAFEKKTSSSERLKDEDGNLWYEEREWDFKTGELPYPIPDEEILTTIPIRRQRYLLQDEALAKIGKIEFTMDMKDNDPDTGYFPEDNEEFDYSYFVRWQDLKGGEPTTFDLNVVETSNVIDQILTIFPDLKNNTIYSCQLIRKKKKKGIMIDLASVQTFKSIDNKNQMESTTEVTIEVDPIDPGQSIGLNEEMIYQYYFKTSKFNSYIEKISSAEISHEIANVGYYVGEYPLISLQLEEGFDVFDVKGEINGDGLLVTAPRFKFFCEDEYESSINMSSMTVTGSQYHGSSSNSNSNGFTNTSSSAQARYFSKIQNGWDDFRSDASPIWQECSIPGGCWYLHNVNYSNSSAFYGEIYNDNTTIGSHFHDPDVDFYFNYYEEGPLELSFNDFIAGYDDPLSDSEISNAWSAHLANQEAISNLTSKATHAGNSAPINQSVGNGFGNFENSNYNGAVSNPNMSTTINNSNSINQASHHSTIENTSINYVNENDANNSSSTINNSQSSNPVRLTIPFKLHPLAEADAYQLWNYGYDLYWEYIDVRFDYEVLVVPPNGYIDVTETIPKLKWQNLIRDEYPTFKTAFLEKEDRAHYYLKENKGNYYLKIQGNKAFSPEHVGGNKKTLDFRID